MRKWTRQCYGGCGATLRTNKLGKSGVAPDLRSLMDPPTVTAPAGTVPPVPPPPPPTLLLPEGPAKDSPGANAARPRTIALAGPCGDDGMVVVAVPECHGPLPPIGAVGTTVGAAAPCAWGWYCWPGRACAAPALLPPPPDDGTAVDAGPLPPLPPGNVRAWDGIRTGDANAVDADDSFGGTGS